MEMDIRPVDPQAPWPAQETASPGQPAAGTADAPAAPQAVPQGGASERAARLDRLAHAIQRGAYAPSPAGIARAILAKLLGGGQR